MNVAKSSFTELPTIDISDLASDSLAQRQAVADTIGKAAREVGFFYITGHGIAPELIAGIRTAAKRLFALPMDQKMQYYIGHSRSHKGYVPEGKRSTVPASRTTKKRLILAFRPRMTTRLYWPERR